MKHWIDNADSWICPVCGLEVSSPAKYKGCKCPKCGFQDEKDKVKSITLEAVWFNNGKEVYKVSPVMNILYDDSMKSIEDIEVYDGDEWYSCGINQIDADVLMIRIKKD